MVLQEVRGWAVSLEFASGDVVSFEEALDSFRDPRVAVRDGSQRNLLRQLVLVGRVHQLQVEPRIE